MKRLGGKFSPVLVVGLTILWLLLNQTVAPAQIALGVLLSLALAWASSTLRPLRARVQRLDIAALLLLVVLKDIVRSNIAVARIVLGFRASKPCTGFLEIPLELRDPHGLAALAAIITSTPGTVWAGLSPDGSVLTLHVLDLKTEGEWIELIKHRYERPLMRIFQ